MPVFISFYDMHDIITDDGDQNPLLKINGLEKLEELCSNLWNT